MAQGVTIGIGRALRAAAAAALLVGLVAPGVAQGRTITVGSPLRSLFNQTIVPTAPSAMVANLALDDPEADAVSPVDGAVLRWRLGPQPETDGFALKVLHPNGDGSYTVTGTSTAHVATTDSIQVFETDLPILAGDLIGLESLQQPDPKFAAAVVGGTTGSYWAPTLGNGATAPLSGEVIGQEFDFDAEVQPAPQVVLISQRSGSTAGGTTLTIAGTDFPRLPGSSSGRRRRARSPSTRRPKSPRPRRP